jgi:hypothetical protein
MAGSPVFRQLLSIDRRLPAASAATAAITAVTVSTAATAATTTAATRPSATATTWPSTATTTAEPATATAATRSSTTAASATALPRRTSFVDHNVAAHEILAIQTLNGAVGFFVVIDLDKSEPARLP